jgi:hypothetical protein
MATNRAALQERGPQIAASGHFGLLEIVRVDTKRWEATFRTAGPHGPIGPEETVPLSTIEPLGEEGTEKLWKMLVDDVFAVLKAEKRLPDFVKGCEVTTGTDSTGEPSVYVRILVAPKQVYSQSTTSRWQEFSLLLQSRLTAMRFLKRYPYIQFGEKRKGK